MDITFGLQAGFDILGWLGFDANVVNVGLKDGKVLVKIDLLQQQMVVNEEGYAYIFVSNENPTQVDIHFDDLRISHGKTKVVQYNEYYPFGLQTSNSWTREDSSNDFLYNSGNELNSASGWYETFFRGYDASLGRFLQVDPMTTKYSSFTGYNYGFNDPVFWNDPGGADPGDAEAAYWRIYDQYGFDAANNWQMYGSQYGVTTSPRHLLVGGGGSGGGGGGSSQSITISETEQIKEVWEAILSGSIKIGDELFLYSTIVGEAGIIEDGNGNIIGDWGGFLQDYGAIDFQQTQGGNQVDLFSFGSQVFDMGATVYGGIESGITAFRQANGAQIMNRAIGFGTQRQAAALLGTAGKVGTLAKGLGAFGYGLQVVSIGSKVLNGEKISTADKVGFGVSTVLVGAAWVAGTTFLAPWVAGGALIYGGAELLSYGFTGESLETNIFGK